MTDGPLAPPQKLEAEQSVLGAVLLSDTALPGILSEGLQPEDFCREACAVVFRALDMHARGEPVDPLTLEERLCQAGEVDWVGGRAAVDHLAASVPAVGNVRHYARIVRENAMLRRLLAAAYEIQGRAHSRDPPPRELVDMAAWAILEVAHEARRVERNGGRMVDGAEFVLDAPSHTPAVWGSGREEVAWAQGEALMVYGPQGVRKSTLAQQLALARCGIADDDVLGLRVTLGPVGPHRHRRADLPGGSAAQRVAVTRGRAADLLQRGTGDRRLVSRRPDRRNGLDGALREA